MNVFSTIRYFRYPLIFTTYITFSIGLQVTNLVSMDYTIIMLNHFTKEWLREGYNLWDGVWVFCL